MPISVSCFIFKIYRSERLNVSMEQGEDISTRCWFQVAR